MEENNKENPEVKVSGKKTGKKAKRIAIIVAIIAVLLIVAILVLFFTGNLNLTKGSKAWAGINKMGETFTKPVEEIANSSKTKIEGLTEKPFEYSAEISANIEELNITGMTSSEKKVIDDVTGLLDGSNINLNLKVDPKENDFSGSISASIKDIIENISGDIVYKDNELALRSKEINENYLTISKDSLEGTEYEEYAEFFDIIESINFDELTSFMLSEEEVQHFKDTYKDILKEELKDKEMKSSSDKVKVDGKSKSCTKVVVTLDDADVADLISAYIDAFKNDEKGREIIKEKVIKIAELAGEELTAEDVDEYINEFVTEAESVVDQISFDGNVKLTTYGTMFKTYRTDVEIEIEDETVSLEFVYNDKNTEIALNVADQEIGTLTIVNEDKNKEFKLALNEEITGQKMELGLQFQNEDNKYTTSITFNGEIEGVEASAKLVEEETRTTDTETELARENKLTIDVDITNLITFKGTISINDNIKALDNAGIPEITDSNSVDMLTDEAGLQTYVTNSEAGLTKILEELQNSTFLKEYMNYAY